MITMIVAAIFSILACLTWQALKHAIEPQEVNRDPFTGQLPGKQSESNY